MKTLLLSKDDVQASLTMKGVIDAVKEGYAAFEKGDVQQPDIVSMEMPAYNGETDIKSCYNEQNESISVKTASGFFDNGKNTTLPTMIALIQIFDGKTGAPLCVMDGSLITGIRTGAAGAISCEYLSRKDAHTICVIGGGGQARMQVYGACEVRNIDTIKVFSPYPAELPKYKEDIERKTGAKVILCDTVEEAADGADIIITSTPSKQFIVPANVIKPGVHIVAVGADMPGKNEIDPQIFKNAKIVNDNKAQCFGRGETRNALIAGIIEEADIYAEIGEIVLGKKPGRTGDDEITIFDTTGMAVQDNVTAMNVYRMAKENGMGTYFEFVEGDM